MVSPLLRRNPIEVLQAGKRLYRFSRFPLRYAQFVKALQVKPELGTRAEEMGQTQGSVSRDGALPVQNAGDAVGRHIQLARQFGGAHAEFSQFFGQVFARMYRGHCHSVLPVPSDNLQSLRSTVPKLRPATQNRSATAR